MQAYLQGQTLFTQDLYAGADPANRVRVRLVTTYAWAALFARNMFIRPPAEDLAGFEPDYVILHAPLFQADPAVDGVRTSTAIALSFEQKLIVIAGSEYAGEIKKSIFTVMNWLLPERGVLPMHCSANIGPEDDVALFFGLSGTGKTTLSSDPHRRLIGDDEHGWGENGVFNFEGGCYAKVINLSKEAEPEIYAASHRFGTVLENVVGDHHGRVDLADKSLTENTRACYPVEFIPNVELSGRGGQPKNVVMLTADAFGVLPPISRLTPAQAMYHFLSGYTARVAGTEKGMGAEPQATFSTCFGAPFLPRRPEVYGRMLSELIARYGADCWLVNTGWSGGPPHPRAAARRAGRLTFQGEVPPGPAFRPVDPGARAGRAGRGAGSAPDLGGQGRLRPDGQGTGEAVRGELRSVRGRCRRRRPRGGDPRGCLSGRSGGSEAHLPVRLRRERPCRLGRAFPREAGWFDRAFSGERRVGSILRRRAGFVLGPKAVDSHRVQGRTTEDTERPNGRDRRGELGREEGSTA